MLALSINLGFSEHLVRADAVYSVLALSAFKAGPFAARAIGVIPRKRKTDDPINLQTDIFSRL